MHTTTALIVAAAALAVSDAFVIPNPPTKLGMMRKPPLPELGAKPHHPNHHPLMKDRSPPKATGDSALGSSVNAKQDDMEKRAPPRGGGKPHRHHHRPSGSKATPPADAPSGETTSGSDGAASKRDEMEKRAPSPGHHPHGKPHRPYSKPPPIPPSLINPDTPNIAPDKRQFDDDLD